MRSRQRDRKIGAVVEMHGHHVAHRCAGDRLEVILDLPRPRAGIVTAIAENSQRRSVDQPVVGGHDAPIRRVDDARILGRRDPSVPSARAIRP